MIRFVTFVLAGLAALDVAGGCVYAAAGRTGAAVAIWLGGALLLGAAVALDRGHWHA